MDRDKQIQVLRREITEVEELISRWQDRTDSETRWAVDMLKQCLARRKHVLAALLFQNGGLASK